MADPGAGRPAWFDWLFRNRHTGEITIAQFPNLPIALWAATRVVDLVAAPAGTAGDVLTVVGTAALLFWAADELVRGVNPWRRILGAGVLAWQVATLL